MDINSWLLIGLVVATLASIGRAVDQFMVLRQKTVLHYKMTAWWLKIDGSNFPDLAVRAAKNAISFMDTLSNKSRNSRVLQLLLMVFISWLLTSVTSFLGNILDYDFQTTFESSTIGLPLPVLAIYLANIPFDLLTIVATYFALKHFIGAPLYKGIAVIVIDILIAATLAVLAHGFIAWSSNNSEEYGWPGESLRNKNLFQEYAHWKHSHLVSEHGFSGKATITSSRANLSLMYFLKGSPEELANMFTLHALSENNNLKITIKEDNRVFHTEIEAKYYPDFSHMIPALTTLIPTVLFWCYLLFLIVAKVLIDLLRIFALQYLEAVTETSPQKDPKNFIPGTMFGTTMGVLVVIANGVVKLLKN